MSEFCEHIEADLGQRILTYAESKKLRCKICTPPMLDVVVKRSLWLRGESDSFLLRESDGKMCCMGFASLAAGMTREKILGQRTPAGACLHHSIPIPSALSKVIEIRKGHHDQPSQPSSSSTAYYLFATNDRASMSEVEREAAIIQFGRDVGINFSFVD